MSTPAFTPVERIVVVVCSVVLWVSMSATFAILVVNTALRYAMGSSLQWASEVPEMLFPWMVTAGVVLAAQHGAHITTSFLMDAIPQRPRRVIGICSWLVVAALYATLAVATFQMLPVVHDEKSPILQIPGSITYACVMGGMTILAVLAIQSAWRLWQPTKAEADNNPSVPTAHW